MLNQALNLFQGLMALITINIRTSIHEIPKQVRDDGVRDDVVRDDEFLFSSG